MWSLYNSTSSSLPQPPLHRGSIVWWGLRRKYRLRGTLNWPKFRLWSFWPNRKRRNESLHEIYLHVYIIYSCIYVIYMLQRICGTSYSPEFLARIYIYIIYMFFAYFSNVFFFLFLCSKIFCGGAHMRDIILKTYLRNVFISRIISVQKTYCQSLLICLLLTLEI